MAKEVPADPTFEALLDYLKKNRGFDFTGYKRSSLVRRVQKRLMILELDNFVDYIDYLEVHPDEFDALFDTILINVTSFFRDSEPWEFLQQQILPGIIAGSDHIRVWCAGCATGEEAYTTAMVLCEALGEKEFHKRVKIYATDVDEGALAKARQAIYEAQSLEKVSPELREKYFSHTSNGFVFKQDLRRCVIFGRHDLVQDAPIPKLNLLICRNTLMYLNAETQARILRRFHFALKSDGYLFLGRAEMLLSHGNLFEPVDLQNRIFTKATKVGNRDGLFDVIQARPSENGEQVAEYVHLKQHSYEKSHIAQLIVSQTVLKLANEKACTLLNLKREDIGKNFKDLEISYRPIELRSLVEQCIEQKRPIKLGRVDRLQQDGTMQALEVQITPLAGTDGRVLGTSITFDDVSKFHGLCQDLESAHGELESTNTKLESMNEELETTNEELQSTNEELETTNEELQSANEELETMNEELQSCNEELEATNDELQSLTQEVEITNSLLQGILGNITSGIVVVDKEYRVRIWNARCEKLWGLRFDEVLGSSLFDLDIGLPVEQLRDLMSKCRLDRHHHETTVAAVNRRGVAFQCDVSISPMISKREEGGLVLVMDGDVR